MELDSKRWTTSIAKHTQSVLSRCFFSMQFPNVNYFRQQCLVPPFSKGKFLGGALSPSLEKFEKEGQGRFLSLSEGREIFVTKLRKGIIQSALRHSKLDAHFCKSNADGFRVQDWHAHFSFQVLGRDKGWNNCATERDEAARAAHFDGGAHDLNGTGKYLVYSLLGGLVVEADCGNLFDKNLHAVGANNLPGICYVLFEGRNDCDRA